MYQTAQGLCCYFWCTHLDQAIKDSFSLYISLSPFLSLSLSLSITHTHNNLPSMGDPESSLPPPKAWRKAPGGENCWCCWWWWWGRWGRPSSWGSGGRGSLPWVMINIKYKESVSEKENSRRRKNLYCFNLHKQTRTNRQTEKTV